jgi:preprotein translocase subunit SecA
MFAQHLDPRTGENEFGSGGSVGLGSPGSYGGLGTALADAPTLTDQRDPRDPSSWGKVGRNEPCPCGSGKKFKHCHGSLVA